MRLTEQKGDSQQADQAGWELNMDCVKASLNQFTEPCSMRSNDLILANHDVNRYDPT
jgi:hypothetical protein